MLRLNRHLTATPARITIIAAAVALAGCGVDPAQIEEIACTVAEGTLSTAVGFRDSFNDDQADRLSSYLSSYQISCAAVGLDPALIARAQCLIQHRKQAAWDAAAGECVGDIDLD